MIPHRSELLILAALALLAAGPGCGGGEGSAARRASEDASSPSGRVFVYGYPSSDRGPVSKIGVYTLDLPGGRLRRVEVPRLGIGDPVDFIEVTGGRLAYFGAGGDTNSIDLGLKMRSRRLGESLFFVDSARDGRVWLQRSQQGAGRVAEVSVDGEVIRRVTIDRPPCAGTSFVATARAFLCQTGRGMVAVDIRGGRVIDELPTFPLATGGSLIAACDEPCPRLQVVEPGLERTKLRPGRGFRWAAGYDGAFSPDLRHLAVPVRLERLTRRTDQRAVALVNLVTGESSLVDERSLGPWTQMEFTSSGWLLYATGGGELMAYRPGDTDPAVVGSLRAINVLDRAAE